MMPPSLPPELKKIYPFKSHYLELEGGNFLHYLKENGEEDDQKEVVILLHGNPTWSFYYRNLILNLRKKFQVIVPDHIGCGLSSKPQDYTYTLDNHIKNLTQLINHIDETQAQLKSKKLNIVVHDWGGAIGFGYATLFPERINKMVILNTAAHLSPHIPWRIGILKTKILGFKAGEWVIRQLNGFAFPATFMAAKKKLSEEVKAGYLYPYQTYADRVAVAGFVQDIPLDEHHPSYSTLEKIEKNLPTVPGEKLILWGGLDFCFNDHFLNKWKHTYPHAEVVVFPQAGHFVMEDACEEVIFRIDHFLSKKSEN